jgi:hypothetical protein
VRTLGQAFCTRIFEFYMLTKDEATLFVSCAVYVLVGLRVIFVTVVMHQVEIFITGYNCACTCIKLYEHM